MFTKAQDDIRKLIVLFTTQKIFSLVLQRSEETFIYNNGKYSFFRESFLSFHQKMTQTDQNIAMDLTLDN